MQDFCVVCGNPVPEGQMVCYECLHKYGLEQPPAQRARRGRRYRMHAREEVHLMDDDIRELYREYGASISISYSSDGSNAQIEMPLFGFGKLVTDAINGRTKKTFDISTMSPDELIALRARISKQLFTLNYDNIMGIRGGANERPNEN